MRTIDNEFLVCLSSKLKKKKTIANKATVFETNTFTITK